MDMLEVQLDRLKVGSTQIDHVRTFSYLGKIVNRNNALEGDIIEKITKWNKAFYATKTPFKSKLVYRKSK
jgi:hypothetical protein